MSLRQLFACGLVLFMGPACSLPASPPRSPFQGERAFSDLEQLVALGPRVSGTESSRRTRDMIREAVEAAGLTVHEYPFNAQTPLGERPMVNVVAEVQGTKPGVILLSNHYDTKHFPDFEFVGANDGGSTTAWMMEMARVLGPRREGRTVWLCWFDGEEAFGEWSDTDSLYGSRRMVSRLRESGGLSEVHVVVNIDMIGDCDLGVITDSRAPAWLRDLVDATARDLRHEDFMMPIVQSIDDDHVPFRDAGIPAIDLIDFRYGGGRSEHDMNWHTSRDRLERVCARSLQTTGDVVYHLLPGLDRELDQRTTSP